MTLKLFCDLMSQPSRALYIILKAAKQDFQPKIINLGRGEQFSEEFEKVNRFNKVPVIDHDGFVLTESVAIMKYLALENMIPETLYPKERIAQARVNEFLEWQHIGLRVPASLFFKTKFLNKLITGEDPDPEKISELEDNLMAALEDFDTKWLGRGADYIVGNSPTVADILAACELEQPRIAGFDPKEKFRNINIWAKKVQENFNPHYDEAHKIIYKIIRMQIQTSANQ